MPISDERMSALFPILRQARRSRVKQSNLLGYIWRKRCAQTSPVNPHLWPLPQEPEIAEAQSMIDRGWRPPEVEGEAA